MAMLSEKRKAQAKPLAAALKSEETLTPRELDVLRLMAAGQGTEAIADRLSLQPPTVRNHIQRLMAKPGVHSRLEAVAAASTRGLL